MLTRYRLPPRHLHVFRISFAVIVPIVSIIMLILVFLRPVHLRPGDSHPVASPSWCPRGLLPPDLPQLLPCRVLLRRHALHLAIGLPLFYLGSPCTSPATWASALMTGSPSLDAALPALQLPRLPAGSGHRHNLPGLLLIRFDLSLGIVALGTVIMGLLHRPHRRFLQQPRLQPPGGISGDIFAVAGRSSDEKAPRHLPDRRVSGPRTPGRSTPSPPCQPRCGTSQASRP